MINTAKPFDMTQVAKAAGLDIPIRLSFPVIGLNTKEVARARDMFKNLAKHIGTTGKAFREVRFVEDVNPDAISSWIDQADKDGMEGLILFDAFFFDRQRADPRCLPGLKSSITLMEDRGVNYIVAGGDVLDEEFVYQADMPLMGYEESSWLLKCCEEDVSSEPIFDADERELIVNNAAGLSHMQLKNIYMTCCYLKHVGKPFLANIRREKQRFLRDAGLDVMEAEDIGHVGGLDNLKEFLRVRRIGWDKGLPAKGMLLAGVPGGGKTLVAKATALVLGTTLVRMDMGRFYDKHLGETESRFRAALRAVEQIAPVVLLLDELEKSFGQGHGGHEVSRRLLGEFLYWLQERKARVFVVATTNRINELPAELTRSGRWDRSFFVDLPTQIERDAILRIHLRHHELDPDDYDLATLVKRCEGHSGAEIEMAILDAIYAATANGTDLDDAALCKAISDVVPISESRSEDIERIRDLRNRGFYVANAEGDGSPETEQASIGTSSGRRLSIGD